MVGSGAAVTSGAAAVPSGRCRGFRCRGSFWDGLIVIVVAARHRAQDEGKGEAQPD